MISLEEKILKDAQIEFLFDNDDYSTAADYLFNSQLVNWSLLNKNYDSLTNVQSKSIWFDGFKLKVQFNPERIKSTLAKVDEDSVKSRKCFLCIENLPAEQKGILLLNDFILLCNPYPILPRHFTISSVKHRPQQVLESFSDLLELTRMLSPGYSLIYNGPACGASAPDHLHFQAGTKNFISVENDIQQLKNDFGRIVLEDEYITISFINDGLRKIIFIESIDKKEVEKRFRLIYKIFRNQALGQLEPMMNILSYYDEEIGWSLIIFMRSKHRPDCFYENDPGNILISPAAIDLAGVVVTPREEDYLKVDKELLSRIFNEVSLDQKSFFNLEKKVKSEIN
jgi:hypothetical protein